jgi:hypothetical protein
MPSVEIGTWRADLTQSHWVPGRKPLSDTLTILDSPTKPGALRITSTRVFANGPVLVSTDAIYDGNYYNLVSSSNLHQNFDACAYTQTSNNPLTITFSRRNPGEQVVAQGTIVMSNNNNTRTVTVTTDNGRTNNYVIYHRLVTSESLLSRLFGRIFRS